MKPIEQDPATAAFTQTDDYLVVFGTEISQSFGVEPGEIEAIQACTPFQRDVLDWAAPDKRRAFGHVVYQIPDHVNIDRLVVAWKEVVCQTAALRTCIFSTKLQGHLQVTLSSNFTWKSLSRSGLDIAEVVEDEKTAATAGAKCNRYVLVEDPKTKQRLLIWTFSHALIDTPFQQDVIGKVRVAYDGGDLACPTESGRSSQSYSSTENMAKFWQHHLHDLGASVFPAPPASFVLPNPNGEAEHKFYFSNSGHQNSRHNDVVCRAALAVLLARYTNASEALFGFMTERQPRLMDGPTRRVLPIRVPCAPHHSLMDLMQALNAYDAAIADFEQINLDDIRRVAGEVGSAACDFQTVFVVTTDDTHHLTPDTLHHAITHSDKFVPWTDHALLLECHISRNSKAVLRAKFDPNVIDTRQINRFLRQLGFLIKTLKDNRRNDLSVAELDPFTAEDRAEIEEWNSKPLRTHEVCIHDVITEKAAQSPNSPAVSAWDGDWSYRELEDISSHLARHIQSSDLKLGQVVPLCFEKSKWVVVGILAVLKAGRAFTLIDPSTPPARVSQICQQVSATTALTTNIHYQNMRAVVSHCIVIDDKFVGALPREKHDFKSTARPQDLAYVIFTSGSTGEPKGSLIEHRSFASCSLEVGGSFGLRVSSRALQVASYAFSACLGEILTTLMHGACVCIPSEEERINNIPAFISRKKVNWALFTPSYMRAIEPGSVSSLETIVLVGEPMSLEIRDIWASRVQLLYGYGQSESSSACSLARVKQNTVDIQNIGRGIGARLWITDPHDHNRLAPIGCIGELVVQSPGIARGYINPSQGPSPFLNTPPAWYSTKQPQQLDCTRFYKTGDLVYYGPDGAVLYLGRMDSQIKIRGQRVELGDVESHLRRQVPKHFTTVVEVVKRSNRPKEAILVAFLIGPFPHEHEGASGDIPRRTGAYVLEKTDASRIQAKLQEFLPRYCIPSYYVRMEELPMTTTGKTHRKSLRSIGSKLLDELHGCAPSESEEAIERPTGHIEATLRQLWCQVLNLDPDSPKAKMSFFDLGGDSISATKLVNIARLSGLSISVADIFQSPTLNGLMERVVVSSIQDGRIPSIPHNGLVEQSFAQGRLWFLDQLQLGRSWYILPLATRLRGRLDIDALTAALSALEQRHETLRTTFEERDGTGLQLVHAPFIKEIRVVDISAHGDHLEALRKEQTKPFELISTPGWRVAVFRLGQEDHILSIVMHHIISDGWSVDILRRELNQLYTAALQDRDPLSQLAPLPIQYSDFAAWQRQDDQQAEHQQQLDYWTEQLADSAPAEFLCDKPRPAALSGDAEAVELSIEGQMFEKLQAFCIGHQVTAFTTLLAVFRIAHFRLTGAEDATIGTPIANRNRPELEDMIGFFVNTQCIRIAIEDGETFEGLVRHIRATTMAAFKNQDIPFERIVSALLPGSRDTSRNPLVQLMFALHSQRDLGKIQLDGLESEPVIMQATTRFDLEFHLFQEEDRLTGRILFATDLFEADTIRTLVCVFHEVLRRGLDKPQTAIATMPLTDRLTELGRMGLLDIERTNYPRDSSVVDVFHEQVAVCPDSIAVKDSSSQLTYARLDEKSDELAAWLRRRRLAPETVVGVLAPRSCETIVAFLGILKANLAYLPLDTNIPAARVEAILSVVPGQKLVLLGSEVARPDIPLSDVEWVKIVNCQGQGSVKDYAAEVVNLPSATSLAYVMFTSGSTGKPKGVMVEHRGILRLVKNTNLLTSSRTKLCVAHISNVAFDAATWEIFVALLNGGTTVCIDYMDTLDSSTLHYRFLEDNINTAFFTVALLRHCLNQSRSTLALLTALYAGGETLRPDDARETQKLISGTFRNAYGPTENTTFSTVYEVVEGEAFVNGVSIGRAVSNSGAYIMDPMQQLVSPGVMGELVVTGDGLARGYTDPALDVDRFIQVTIKGETIRAYRTGDRARWRPKDGQIEFFGRMDQQIKIRGHRIEPAEVEQAILAQDTVHNAAVVIRQQDGRSPELVAFVAAHTAQSIEQEQASTQVQGWGDHFEMSTYADITTIDHSSIGNDFTGWTSMYDGSIINKMEMQEWLDDTMQTILNGQPAGHVLEIGTGTGMVLFNLGDGLQSYVGIEPSQSAAAFVNSIIKSTPTLADKAKVYVGTAMDIGRLDGLQLDELHPDVVIINSVAQYFPTAAYLSQVIDYLVQIPTVKRLFFGDIRTYAINRDFLAARALHELGDRATRDGIQRRIAELEAREEELLVDPAFFTGLSSRLPDRVKHVEVLPKRMKATNELSAYRYAAVVHIGGPDDVAQPVHKIDASVWTNFRASRMDRDAIVHLLKNSRSTEPVAVSNIPYAKTIVERHIVESLYDDEAEGTPDGFMWISAMRQQAKDCPSLSATDLVEIAKDMGLHVELSCARQRSQHGAIDAVFHHYGSSKGESRVMIQFPTENEGNSLNDLTSRPLQRTEARRVEGQLRERLQALLPSYMMPAQIVVVDHMPVNANGKIDRRELSRMAHKTEPTVRPAFDRVAPRNDIESMLCEEFADVLGVDVGITDSFFDLGGHSLMATKLAARLSRRLDTRISVKDIFDQPIVADLAGIIQRGSSKHRPIPSTPYSGPVEQSFAQGRLWFVDQLNLGPSLYLMPFAVRLRGRLHVEALSTALYTLEQQHETLRTTFEDRDGVGIQVIHKPVFKKLRVVDISAMQETTAYTEILRQEQTLPFDLTSEPGWRVSLLRLGEDDHILSIVMHHIVSDGWSIEVIQKQLGCFYSTALQGQDPLSISTPLPIQYRDFAAWQKQEEQLAEHQLQLDYWTKQLADSTPAELLCDKPRPAVLSSGAGIVQFAIDGPIYEKLQAFCIANQVTVFAVLLAVFRGAHYRLTGTEDATIGTPIANRNRPEVENLIGFFVNTQCMRISVEEGETFEGLIKKVRSITIAAFDNQDVPFERIVSALLPGSRDTSRNPLVQLLFAVHSQYNLGKIELEGLESERLPMGASTRLDLEFHLFQEESHLSGNILFATDLFETETVQGLVSVFQEILRRGLEEPQSPISLLPLTDGLAKLDRIGLLEIQRTEYPYDSSVVDVFREQVATYPEVIAVKDSSSQLTYAKLDQESDAVAAWLRLRKYPAETMVGVLAPRSCETIIAFLGILKANLAYLPLDVKVPAARIESILSAVPGQKLVLVGANITTPEIKLLDVNWVRIADTITGNDQGCMLETTVLPSATSIAYVIFTSGSTGKPKGVVVEHRAIVRLVKDSNLVSKLPRQPRIAHLTNIAFDVSLWEMLTALLNGGTIVCIEYFTSLDSKALEAVFEQEQIRVAMFPRILLKQWLGTNPRSLRGLDFLFVAGDRLDGRDAIHAKALVRRGVVNAYGPTETHICTEYEVQEQETFTNGVPIGRAISSSGVYIMDPKQRLVSPGVIGELVVTGDGLARGYTDTALNAARFVQVIIKGKSVKAYRTGDRARWRPTDGQIEFFGRMDQQIKIRGHRIEPAEVENAMLGHETVRDAAVIVRKHDGCEAELVAFVAFIIVDEENVTAQKVVDVERRLKTLLPTYMLPTQILAIDQMPVNANGKADRRELERRARTAAPTIRPPSVRVVPRNEVEAVLCQEFADILGVDVGITDNFFEAGGHSLMATKLAARVSRRLDVRLSVKDVFDQPVVADLAAIIRRGSARHSPIPVAAYTGPVQQSFAQGRLWFLDQLNVNASWYLMPLAVRMRGPLHLDALTTALHALEQRHETLRTTFEERDGTGVQIVHDYSPKPLRIIDVSTRHGEGYIEPLRQEQSTPFHLATEPGWRVALIRVGEEDHILSIVMHHIISDGWSIDVLRRELSQFYTTALQGQDPLFSATPLPIQYRDFTIWQKQEDQSLEHQRQLNYWIDQLTDSVPAELLCDKPRPAILSGDAGNIEVVIEGQVYERLESFCIAQQVTTFNVLLAVFRAAHYRLTGAEDATIGTPIANRNRPELEDLIGFFVNMQCMRIAIEDGETFEGLIKQVRSTTAVAFENQDVPFERVVSALLPGSRDASRNPLVQLVFALHSQRNLRTLQLEGLDSEYVPVAPTTRLDLEFHLFQEEKRLGGSVLFATDLFENDTICGLVAIFHEILRRGLDEPQTPIATMPLTDGLSELDHMGLLEIERTNYPRELSVVDIFRQQAATHPDIVAVRDSLSQLTYAELNQESDELAAWLRRRHFNDETPIGVLAPRSCKTIVAFIGILKANLVYLPLDVKVPAARIKAILSAIPGKKLVLLGVDISTPDVNLLNVEWVQIADTLGQCTTIERSDIMALPSATSLAYIMFTSGSTGKPKGVMVEHRGIVRLVKSTNLLTSSTKTCVAHISNIAFDAATWEIFTALLNGGTIICIDYMDTLDPYTLYRRFLNDNINTAFFTIALLRLCLNQFPSIFTLLITLLAGGETMQPDDAREAQQLVNGTVCNGYGPTENTTFSTVYEVIKDGVFVNGVPIGRAVSNSGAYIMDPIQQLVGPGVMGELVVTGDGLARGYTDTALNTARFVQVTIKGKSVKAYRTGDRARWRPTDGQIEFFGRLDQQIKIRGHRIEPAEVEQAILAQETVRDAAVIVQKHEESEPELVAFATIYAHNSIEQDEAISQVEGWGNHFETSTYADITALDHSYIGNDFMGWTSMYDGRIIDKNEMQEWLKDTMQTLLDGEPAGHVLEIGTGTGMILFNLGEGLQSYVGLEPSRSAASFVNAMIKSTPALSGKAEVHIGTAMDISRLKGLRPDIVVINSVAQYFPTAEYLLQIINCLTQIPTVKRIFFGDIRTYAINRDFLTARALYALGEKASKDAIRQKIAGMEESEEELLVDPSFFTHLTSSIASRIKHVEILPKKMKATNELSAYRYAAILHVANPDDLAQPVYTIDPNTWLDFKGLGLNRKALVRLLQNSAHAQAVAISNIPYEKTSIERHVLESLYDDDTESSLDGAAWILEARRAAASCPSLSATDLVEIGEEAGFKVELSWARQRSNQGGLDAVFHQYAPTKGTRVMIEFPVEEEDRPSGLFTNRPLQQIQNRRLEARIRDQLQGILPSYMIPAHIIVVDRMPINANGKVDRRELARRARISKSTIKPAAMRVAPRNQVEAALCDEFTAVLGIAVSITDNFFDLGGHSLMATKLAARISRRLHARVSVKDVFDQPVLADLAAIIQQGSNQHKPIPSTAYAGPVEQSFAQGRLWFLDQLNVGASWYLMPITTRLRGPLQIDALKNALDCLERRHETLRTTFEQRDDVAVQIVHESLPKPLRVVDVSETQDMSYAELLKKQTTPFDLKTEPGWRVSLLRLGEDDHILSIVMHHIISDGWSVDILRQELGHFYAAALQGQSPLSQVTPLPIHYRDFAMWQKQEEQMVEHQRQLDYWTEQLADSTPAELLCDKPRPVVLSGHAGNIQLSIEGQVYERLQAFCRDQQVTPFAALLAAFRATHYRLTGVEDATVGTPIANRNRPELENMIGFFVNTQCMRITVEDGVTFEELVQQVRCTTTAAFENQDVPFERIVSALLPGSRDTSKNPLVQLIFALHSQRDIGQIQLEGLESEFVPVAPTTRLDLEFHLYQGEGRLHGSVLFATELFEADTIRGLVSVFQEVLRRCLNRPQTPVAVVPLTEGLADLRSMGLLEVERTNYPRESSVVDVFHEEVAACPNAMAVKDASSQLTYSELDEKSNELAAWLRQRHFAPETLVGVLAPRSCETIVAFLGILKANLAYLPLDTNVPTARLDSILSAVPGRRLVLLGAAVSVPDFKSSEVEWVRIGDTLNHAGQDRESSIVVLPSAASLAYVMFTSGSTGKPKGVMVEHRGILRLVKNTNLLTSSRVKNRVAHLSNIAFDAATWEIFVALLNGGTIICLNYTDTLDSYTLHHTFLDNNINTAFFTTALLKYYLNQSPATLTLLTALYAGGETMRPHHARETQRLVNGIFRHVYGPTENTSFSTVYEVQEQERFTNGVPIGRAISNSGAYIMDPTQQLVGTGIMGELVVTGDGLARGYTDSNLDIDRFVQVTIDNEIVRAYRTGDRARWRPTDGQIEFFGRMDQQVKIRGHRIEPAEVEHAMLAQDAVRDAAVVVVRKHEDFDPELIAFAAVHGDDDTEQGEAISQVEGWGNHFEISTYADITALDRSNIGNDFIGWTSMYDGSDINKDEMKEWLKDTIQTLLDSQPVGHVLEIGTGSGMILFNLGESLQSYIGLEPSRSAATFVNNTIKSMPTLAGKAEVHVGTAMDIDRLNGLRPDVVVINSVAQYFPTAEYLLQVIKRLTQIPTVKRIFLGDIRTYAINKDFLAARVLRMLGEKTTKDHFRRKIEEMEQREEELLVDPTFFTRLTSQMADSVKHVEILPKQMKATNELSSYRYAAVLHVAEHPPQQIHTVDTDAWVDFKRSKMDYSALVSLLQSSRDALTVAVSNIPYSKTILERHIVELLHGDDTESLSEEANWISEARRAASSCPSLSATDLLEIAKEAGFRVELSWARQRVQHGAIDAVFHHYDGSSKGGSRVMIKFPTEKRFGSSAALTSRPLQRVQNRRLEARVREHLQTLLPAYMIPAQIILVDQMPLNASGKLDRRELGRRARIAAPIVRAASVRVAPRNEVEAMLCEEFAAVLGVDVGITDNFFEVGGHSLMATRLAARVSRRLELHVSVKDIFDQPILADLANIVSSRLAQVQAGSNSLTQIPDYFPLQLLPVEDSEAFLRDNIVSQLPCPRNQILDVYPATWVQEIYLHDRMTGFPRTPPSFFIDFPPDSDCHSLVKTVQALIDHFDIFRTVFLPVAGTFYQVVMERLEVPIDIIEAQQDVLSSMRTLWQEDLQKPLVLGQSFLRVAILKQSKSPLRVVLRMSHALYDGLSFEHIVRSFHALYNGHVLPPATNFARYVHHMACSRQHSRGFWRSVLQNSSMTIIEAPGRASRQSRPNGIWLYEKIVKISAQTSSDGITQATVFTTACGLMLANETGSRDVVFGRVVSGRQCLPVDCQNIVGPCTNYVPVRMSLENMDNSRELLRNIQGQYIDSMPFETLGFNDMKENCTDWPDSILDYGCCTRFQNFAVEPESRIQNERIQLQYLHPDMTDATGMSMTDNQIRKRFSNQSPIHEVDISGIPESDGCHLRVSVMADAKVFGEDQTERMLNGLCERIQLLNSIM